MNTIKRLLSAALSVAIALSLLILPANAAELTIGSQKSDNITISGVPDPVFFSATGTYNCRIVLIDGALTLQIREPSSGAGYETAKEFGFTGERLYYGGLMIKKVNGSGWVAGDTFYFNIKGDSEMTLFNPVINQVNLYSANTLGAKPCTGAEISVTTKIYRRKLLDAKFIVVDPNVSAADVNRSVTPRVLFNVGAFVREGADPTVKAIDLSSNDRAAFEVILPDLRYSGHGNSINFTIQYETADGAEHAAECSYTVTNAVEYVRDDDDGSDDSSSKDLDPLIPYIIVDSYSFGGDTVTAGADFDLKLILRNTSSTHTLENIVMNISPTGVFSMSSSSNTIYINELFAGGNIEKTVTINTGLTKVTDAEDANAINISFSYQYVDNEQRLSNKSEERITIPVSFPDRFEIGTPEIPDMAYEGEEFSIYIPFVNKGRSGVYNVSATLQGNMANAGQSQYVGNLEAGSENGADFYIRPLEAGMLEGEILITYEDTNMNPKELSYKFTIPVQSFTIPEDPTGGIDFPIDPGPVEPVDAKPDHTKTIAIAMGVVVAGMSFYITVQKAKAKRSIFEDEDI